MPEQEQGVMWYDLFEDYFGLHVKDPVRWEQELQHVTAGLSNDDLCRIIRSKSRTTWDLKRKANLADLSGWVREDRSPEESERERCPHCDGGWMSFDWDNGILQVWKMNGVNTATCPCVCQAGEVHLERMLQRGTDRTRMENLQRLVMAAQEHALDYEVPDTVHRIPEYKDPEEHISKPVKAVTDEQEGKVKDEPSSTAPF